MEATHKAVIDSVVELTRQRELNHLADSLIQTLQELTVIKDAFLYSVPMNAHSGRDGFAEDSGPALDEACQKVISQCISTRAVSAIKSLGPTTAEPKSLIAVPILNHSRSLVSHVLCFSADSMSESNEVLISGFARVFENFARVIEDGERDPLTGLLNRKNFHSKINTVIKASKVAASLPQTLDEQNRRQKSKSPSYWLGVIDIDFFKLINDKFGHLYGDDVLVMVSRILTESVRDGDLLFRYGGEEFVVVIGPSDKSGAIEIFERVRLSIEGKVFGRHNQVTISAGVVEITGHDVPTTVVGKADQALYYSKQHGRNQINFYEELIENGVLAEQEYDNDVEFF